TTLSDRDYYLKNDSRGTIIRSAYIDYAKELFELTGSADNNAAMQAMTVIRLETSLAEKQMSRLEMRDPYKTYNKLAIADLNKITPNIKWDTLLPKYLIQSKDS